MTDVPHRSMPTDAGVDGSARRSPCHPTIAEAVERQRRALRELRTVRSEANYAATRGYRYGPYAVLGGDINYPPAASRHPLPDYAQMRPYNVGSRTLLPHGDMAAPHDLKPDRRVTGKLVHNGYVGCRLASLREDRGPGAAGADRHRRPHRPGVGVQATGRRRLRLPSARSARRTCPRGR
ncbi:hypothetical protein [Streptomyces acidicola]|uniref:hypothetical protein n=1 Tax=Streptomyces acidicola TaxID=2596892 RepID=UPI0034314E33